MNCQHQYKFIPREEETWGVDGGTPAEPAFYLCVLCGYENHSGNPEAEEAGAEADYRYEHERDRRLGL